MRPSNYRAKMRQKQITKLTEQITLSSFKQFLTEFNIAHEFTTSTNIHKYMTVHLSSFKDFELHDFSWHRFLINHDRKDFIFKLEKWIELEFYQ
jgi:hypothetical protein